MHDYPNHLVSNADLMARAAMTLRGVASGVRSWRPTLLLNEAGLVHDRCDRKALGSGMEDHQFNARCFELVPAVWAGQADHLSEFQLSVADPSDEAEPCRAGRAGCDAKGHAEDIIRDLIDSENAGGCNGRSGFSVPQTLGGTLRPLCQPCCRAA